MSCCKTSDKSFDKKMKEFWPIFREQFGRGVGKTSISPLILDYCNGAIPCPFSEAFICYSYPSDSYEFELWFQKFYLDLVEKIKKTEGNKAFSNEQARTLECLIDAVNDDQHLKCLQKVLKEDVKEAELTVLLAIHYFKPLVYDTSYVIDNKSKDCGKCECGEEPSFGETSLGSKKVWHGNPDILVKSSAVTVFLEEDIAKMNLFDNTDGDDNISHGDNNMACEDNTLFSQLIEEKTEKSMSNITKNQAISEAITNAFCQVRRNNVLCKKFIPSFLVTEKYVTVILFNCESDQLLMSSSNPIWDDTQSKLNFSTLLKVWTALNYFHELDETIGKREFLGMFPSSHFRTLVGKAYDTYSNEVKMPLDQKEKVEKTVNTIKCVPSPYDSDESKWRLMNLSYFHDALH